MDDDEENDERGRQEDPLEEIEMKGMVAFLLSIPCSAGLSSIMVETIVMNVYDNYLAIVFAEICFLIILFNVFHFIFCQNNNNKDW